MPSRTQGPGLAKLHDKIEQQVREAVDCIEFMLSKGIDRGESIEKSGFGLRRLHRVYDMLDHYRCELKFEMDSLEQSWVSYQVKHQYRQSYNQLLVYLDQTQDMLLAVLRDLGYLKHLNPNLL
mgnify:CR=1 FL=1